MTSTGKNGIVVEGKAVQNKEYYVGELTGRDFTKVWGPKKVL